MELSKVKYALEHAEGCLQTEKDRLAWANEHKIVPYIQGLLESIEFWEDAVQFWKKAVKQMTN